LLTTRPPCRFPDKDAGWIGGEVTSKEVDDAGKVVLTFVDEKGTVSTQYAQTASQLRSDHNPFRRSQESTLEATTETLTTANESLPPLKNPPLLESQEDLANLSNLNEPSGQYHDLS
jgi:myosin-5